MKNKIVVEVRIEILKKTNKKNKTGLPGLWTWERTTVLIILHCQGGEVLTFKIVE